MSTLNEKRILSQRINEALERDDTVAARSMIRREIRLSGEDHWLLTTLAITYYEERRYKLALRYNQRAFALAPRCPLVLRDYAYTLYMLDHLDRAIKICKHLLKRGRAMAHGECGEGIRATLGLLNDCRYILALCYNELGRKPLAIKYLQGHLKHRSRGVPTAYPLADVRKLAKTWRQQAALDKKPCKGRLAARS